MSRPKPDYLQREQCILDAAISLILRQGYDKTTLGDVALEAGISRGLVYRHFSNKERLFEALLLREVRAYNLAWLDILEKDPAGGTLAGVFRCSLKAVNASPFISSLMRQDRRVFGNYLRRPGNLFQSIQSSRLWVALLEEMQSAGAIRAEIQLQVFAHVMTSLALGLIHTADDPAYGDASGFDDLMNTVADMLERTLTPPDGGNPEAGRAIIQSLAQAALAQFDTPSQ